MDEALPAANVAPIMMTLAGIAYGQPSAIPGYLAHDSLTEGDWSIVWIAKDVAVPVNFAFIAKSAKTGAYAIAIRGTYPNPLSPAYWDDSRQDGPFGDMRPWPGAMPEAMVSQGTWTGFQSVIALSDGQHSFEEAVRAIPPGAAILVTGHSLGGTLAPVIALWMTGLPGKPVPSVYAFAGLTPGNAEFAALFGPGTKLDGRIWRYNNTLDTVPYGWNNVIATKDFYDPAPRGGLLVEGLIAATALRLHSYGYTSVGHEVKLEGKLSGSSIPVAFVGYLFENLYQHLPDTYLALLGAPCLPFLIGFGSIVVARDDATAASLKSNRMPVYFAS